MLYNTDISICNLALAHLKQSPIVSLTDANENARQLNRIFIPTRDAVLRAKHWVFAGVKQALVEVADTTVPGWEYVYAYPSLCLGLRKIFDDTESKNPKRLEFEVTFVPALNAKVICCQVEDAYADYTYQITDPGLFDNSFVMALSFLLAAQVGSTLTGDDTLSAKMMQNYLMLVSDAARINDTERYVKNEEVSSFEECR